MSAFHVIPQGAHFIEASAALQTNEVLLCQDSLSAQLDFLDRPEPVELPEHHDVVVHLRLPPPVVLVHVDLVVDVLHDVPQPTEVADALLGLDLREIAQVRLGHLS